MTAGHVERDDKLTIAAIAVAAMCIVTTDHEALGHGSACLALGGQITRLTTVYFRCSAGNPWIDIAGPAGNLTGALVAWLILQITPTRAARARLLLLLITAFALFWEGGYLFYSMVKLEGDWAFAARAAFGEPTWPWRTGGIVLGILFYLLGMRATGAALRSIASSLARSRPIARLSWLAASIAACVATLAYAPDRLAAVHQAALEIGAGSWPLLVLPALIRVPAAEVNVIINRNYGWIAFANVLYAAFIATLGYGIT